MAVVSHNLTGVDFRAELPRRVTVPGGMVDAHSHARDAKTSELFVEAAKAFGVTEIWTMTALENVASLKERWPGMFQFVGVPAWQNATPTEDFAEDWIRRLEGFYEQGARLAKFHLAPGTQKKWGMDARHPMIQRVAKHAYKLGYHLMTHIGDPKAWFYGTGSYADHACGDFASQFERARPLVEIFADRVHLGAHMGGCLEDVEALAKRLDANANYVIDTSATKWIVRAVAEQSPQGVRDFFVAYQDRIVFGSDLVVGEKYDWDHYASRYWAQRKMWETDCRELSPIEDPDAGKGFDAKRGVFEAEKGDGVARLVGVCLPDEVLLKVYGGNARRCLPRA